MQRSCADVNSSYKQKCWTNSGGPLVNSLLWGWTLHATHLSPGYRANRHISIVEAQLHDLWLLERQDICMIHDGCVGPGIAIKPGTLDPPRSEVWQASMKVTRKDSLQIHPRGDFVKKNQRQVCGCDSWRIRDVLTHGPSRTCQVKSSF